MTFYMSTVELQRSLFTRLVREFNRNVNQIAQVFALWMWLESGLGFPCMALLLHGNNPDIVLRVFDESAAIVSFLLSLGSSDHRHPPETPLILQMVNMELRRDTPIGFDSIYENREAALIGIINNLGDAFLLRNFGDSTAVVGTDVRNLNPNAESFIPTQFQNVTFPRPMVPLAHHNVPTIFRGVPPSPPLSGVSHYEVGESSNAVQQQVSQVGQYKVGGSSNQAERELVEENPLRERQYCFTFEREDGIPTAAALHDFFLRNFGDVVESIEMEETLLGTQPTYALVVFRSTRFLVSLSTKLDNHQAKGS